MRPRVKICGVASADEARLAIDLGADLIGVNFYPPSPRYVEPERAAKLIAEVRETHPTDQVQWVGVFVNRPIAEVGEEARRIGLDLLQFHGDETASDLAPVADRSIKVLRIADELDRVDSRQRLIDDIASYVQLGVWGFLLDRRHPKLWGGTGESWHFGALRHLTESGPLAGRRTLIAGGLTPDNVARAVAAAAPWGIDLCSGIESQPGTKDPASVRRLFEEIDDVESSTAA